MNKKTFEQSKSLSMDQYALTVVRALLTQNRHKRQAVFEIFYRKPCTPELDYIIFAGTHFIIEHLNQFHFSNDDLQFIASEIIPNCGQEFLDYLKEFDSNKIELVGLPEGQIVYPNMPILSLKGEIGQLLLVEASMLSILNVCSSAATVGHLYASQAGNIPIVEFGLRRAHGIQSAYYCSLYSTLGGLIGSSNILARKLNKIASYGTMSHAYVTSFSDDYLNTMKESERVFPLFGMTEKMIVEQLIQKRAKLGFKTAKTSELLAFINYFLTFDGSLSALVDTFDVIQSGFPNFLTCASFLREKGFNTFSIRLDSGDLLSDSLKIRKCLKKFDAENKTDLTVLTKIMATNDINLEFLKELKTSPHSLDILGIGTNLTNFKDIKPIGFVFKLVEESGEPRFKITASKFEKLSFPFSKCVFKINLKNNKNAFLILLENEIIEKGNKEAYVFNAKIGKFELLIFSILDFEKISNKIEMNYTLDNCDFAERVKKTLESENTEVKTVEFVVFSSQIIDFILKELI